MHLLLALLLALPAFADTPLPTPDAYWQGEWSLCDIHVLAKVWSMTDAEATEAMRKRLDKGEVDSLMTELRTGRDLVVPDGFSVCPYYEAYTWEDADALAAWWSVDVYEAKARLETKLIYREEAIVADELKAAHQALDRGMQGGEGTDSYGEGWDGEGYDLSPFFDAGLGWCDAEVLGAYWGTDAFGAKIQYSLKVAGGATRFAKKAVKQARKSLTRNSTLCPFTDLGYNYGDAKFLGATWHISEDEAMARVEEAARKGKLKRIDKLLGPR